MVLLLAWGLAFRRLPAVAPGRGPIVYVAAGLVRRYCSSPPTSCTSWPHAVVARANGVQAEAITLWLLGGVAELHGEPRWMWTGSPSRRSGDRGPGDPGVPVRRRGRPRAAVLDVSDSVDRMGRCAGRRAVVLDQAGRVIGVVSPRDISAAMTLADLRATPPYPLLGADLNAGTVGTRQMGL